MGYTMGMGSAIRTGSPSERWLVSGWAPEMANWSASSTEGPSGAEWAPEMATWSASSTEGPSGAWKVADLERTYHIAIITIISAL